jgi:hypothetical protein
MKLFAPKYESDPRWRRDQWAARNGEAARIYKCVVALRAMIDDVTKDAVSRLATISCAHPTADTIANLASEVRFKIVEIGKELAATKILLAAAENDPRFALAEKEFKPLLEAAAERDASDEKVRIDRRETTWRRALERAEEDPAIKRAERSLADAKAAEAEL